MMSEVFWSFFVSSMIGFIIALLKLCYKSKCKEINLCCLKISRDITAEEHLDLEMPNNTPNNNNNSNNV